jgi:hypothetical protein
MLGNRVGVGSFALWSFASALLAQAVPREDVTGVVVDRDGKPWGGAAVTLWHAPHPAIPDESLCDRVVVPTDAAGTFTARVLVGARYVAWAASPTVAPDRSYRCTHVADRVAAGAPVKLTEAELHWQRRVRLEVDESWTGVLQFVARCRVGPFALRQPVPVVDGALTLPAMPASTAELLAHHGHVLVFTANLALVEGERSSEENLRTKLDRERTITIPPARWHSARFVGADGKGIAGASVLQQEDEPREPLARADADGVVRVAQDAVADVTLLVQGGTGLDAAVDVRDFAPGTAPKQISLGTPGTAKGRVLLDATRPAAGVALLVDKVAGLSGEAQWSASPRLVRTGADGSFAIAGHFPTLTLWCTAVLSAEQRSAWQAPTAAPLSALALVQTLTTATDLQIRLDQLQALEVSVLDARGKAAGPVQVMVVPLPGAGLPEQSFAHSTMELQADPRGRVRFLAPKDAEIAVWAFGEASAGWLRTKVDGRRNELSLDPRHVLPLRVVDAGGKPVAGANVYFTLREDPEAPAAVRTMLPVVDMLRHGRPFGEHRRTGADGYVDVLVPLIGCSLELQCVAGRRHGMADFGWFRGTPPQRFDVPLDR